MNAKQLKQLMKQHEWSVEDVANILSRSTKTVQRWLEGDYDMPEQAAKLLSQHLKHETVAGSDIVEDQDVIKKGTKMHPTHPRLNGYVSGIAANGDNGIDGLYVVGFDLVTKELDIIYKSSIEQCPADRRPETEFSEDDLLDKIKVHANDIIGPKVAGKVSNFPICDSEVALIQIDKRDFKHHIADIFAWINYKGDMTEKLRRNAARYNGKASSLYKEDEGLEHRTFNRTHILRH
jgi:hypothetical protein